MGLKSSLVIDLDELPLDQAGTLRRLLNDANFFTLKEGPPIHPNPDSFQYILTVEAEKAKHIVRTRRRGR